MSIDTRELREFIGKLKSAKEAARGIQKRELNRITDRHLARIKRNTPVGLSPDSPTLRDRWDRSGVVESGTEMSTETFNTAHYAPFWEFGHRQKPGRLVFIELSPGQQLYGQAAREVKSGKYAGKWGITIRLKKPFVKGAFVMTDSEAKAQKELDAACRRIEAKIREGLG